MNNYQDSEKIKVLYVTPYPPARNGIADYACRFREEMEKRGFFFEVFTDDEEKWTVFSPVRVIRIILRFVKKIKKFKPHVIHFETGGSLPREFFLMLFSALKRKKAKLVATVHDPPNLIDSTYLGKFILGIKEFRGLKRLLLTPLTFVPRWVYFNLFVKPFHTIAHYLIYYRFDHFFTLTLSGLKILNERYLIGHKVRVIPHGDLSKSNFTSVNHPLKAHFTKSEKKVLVAYFGFLGPNKGIEDFLDAIFYIATIKPKIFEITEFWLCGGVATGKDKSYAQYLENVVFALNQQFGFDIKLKGFVPEELIDYLFSQIDILVVTGKKPQKKKYAIYSTSGTLIRGMSAGKAILVFKGRGMIDEILSGINGFFYKNSKDLALKLIKLVENPELRAYLGKNAKEHFHNFHSWDFISKEIKRIYQKILEK